MREDNRISDGEIGSGNIFADLGLDVADRLCTHTAFGIQMMKTIRQNGLSQKEASMLLELKQPAALAPDRYSPQ